MHNAVIHKYSGDKMAPFLASEMACQMIFLLNATFVKTILHIFVATRKMHAGKNTKSKRLWVQQSYSRKHYR